MTQERLAAALNEFMRRRVTKPDAFEAMNDTFAKFIADGDAPTYGRDVAAILIAIDAELQAAQAAA